MADEMADSMEILKLTSEKEEIIAISGKGRLEAIESCNLSLFRKFLTCKPFNKMAAKNSIRRAWGVDDAIQILEVGLNLFQFKFHSKFEMDRIFRGGPSSFDTQLLMLQRWKKGMTMGNIKMETALLWIQIWGAPFDIISRQVAKEVGGHDLKHCATHYAVQKNGGNLEYQYGDFLTSQYTSNKSNSEEGEGNGPMKLLDLMVHSLRKTATVREQDPGNPREEDKDDAMIFME
nr:hypothetical protein CFP56_08566 [Quercus suber]